MPAKKTTVTKEEPEKLVKDVLEEKEDVKPESKDPSTAKAGKRSAKAIKEAEEKQAKEERKVSQKDSTEAKPKVKQNPPRSKLSRKSKAYRASYELIEKGKLYAVAEAVELLKKTSKVKFDATVELHVNLNVDPKQADQNVRDNLVLPSGSGKNSRVAVYTEDPAAAKSAGADIAGADDFLADIDKGKLDFDVLITTPQLMPKLAKYARNLGPKGLMPSPKNGTVTADIKKAISEAKSGKVEYRVDSHGIIHLGIGKVSFSADQLTDNVTAVMSSIRSNKPSSVKSTFISSAFLTTSMGPSISLDINSLS